MKTNIILIETTLISLALLNGTAYANTECIGNHCIASFAQSNKIQKLPKFKHFTQNIVESVNRDEESEDNIDSYIVSNQAETTQPPIEEDSKSYFASNSTVQIGAFSQYSRAKTYAKRYKLMGDQFRTTITKGIKNHKSIYRVRVEGFESNHEAKQFIAMYSQTGAFLVRK